MIKITAVRTESRWAVQMIGHAMQGPKGQDIVCAAASMLVQACIYGLKKMGAEGIKWDADAGHAVLKAGRGKRTDERVEAMLDGMELLAASYPQAVQIVIKK